MKLPLFVQVAADPTLVPGIYEACDQWCMYCSCHALVPGVPLRP